MKKETKQIIRYGSAVLLGIYIGLLIYCLFFSEKYGRTAGTEQIYRYNLIPFAEIRRFWKYRHQLGEFVVFLNITGNVIGFVPLGFIIPIVSPKIKDGCIITAIGFGISFLIETIQLITKVGCFDVDDLLLNTVGALIGYMLFALCDYFRRMYYGKKI